MYDTSFVNIPDFLPPQNVDAEESILGGLLFDPEAYDRIKDDLSPQAFYCQAHQEIYKAVCDLKSSGYPSDLMTVASYLGDRKKLDKIGGTSKLAQLVERTCSAVNIDRYAALVNDKWVRRQLIKLSIDIKDRALATEEDLSVVLEKIEDLTLVKTQSKYRTNSSRIFAQQQCEKLINEIRAIELEVDQPHHREFMLMGLADKYKIRGGTKVLKNLYHKSLIADENEPVMSIAEAREKYGNEVNEWLLHGFLPKGKVVLLHAPGKVGKTLLAYNFVYHLATGTHWGDFPVTGTKKCLIVQTDETGSDMLKKFADRGIEEGMPIKVKTKWTIDHMQQLRKEILEHKPEMVVIDSLTSVSRNSLVSENDSEYARPILVLRDIAQETGCTILLIHHDSKNNDPRGSSAIVNSVSEVLHLTKDPNDKDIDSNRRILLLERMRSRCPGAYQLELNLENNSWECTGMKDIQEPNGMKTKQAIVQHLLQHPNVKFETIEICELVPGKSPHIRKALSVLANEGIISRQRKSHGSSPFLYFVRQNSDHRSEGSESMIRLESLGNRRIDPNSDHDQKKIAQNDRKNQPKKTLKVMISDQSNGKSNPRKSSDSDLNSDHMSDHSNFFGDLSNSGSVSLVNGQATLSHLESNSNQGSSLPECYLSRFKRGDHVTYTGDQSIHKGKIYEVIRIRPETWCDFSYICQDVAKPKATTVRLKEDDLKLVEKNDEQH